MICCVGIEVKTFRYLTKSIFKEHIKRICLAIYYNLLKCCQFIDYNIFTSFTSPPLASLAFVCSTILEEEKAQQEERMRMEMRRQVTVSWDSGGSDDAPPKVRHSGIIMLDTLRCNFKATGLFYCHFISRSIASKGEANFRMRKMLRFQHCTAFKLSLNYVMIKGYTYRFELF